MGDFVVRDDMSRFGLRRLHVLSHRAPGLAAYLERVKAEGGWLELVVEFQDDIGNCHLYLYWRITMASMYVFTFNGDLQKAAGLAAEGYARRYGKLPNVALVRTGTVEGIAGAKMGLMDTDKNIIGEIEFREDGRMRKGDVGVCWEEEVISEQ